MPVSAFIKIEIYDITGRKIKTLVNEKKSAGRHTVAWKVSFNLSRIITLCNKINEKPRIREYVRWCESVVRMDKIIHPHYLDCL